MGGAVSRFYNSCAVLRTLCRRRRLAAGPLAASTHPHGDLEEDLGRAPRLRGALLRGHLLGLGLHRLGAVAPLGRRLERPVQVARLLGHPLCARVVGLKVLVQRSVDAVVVLHAADLVQPALADLLPAGRAGGGRWYSERVGVRSMGALQAGCGGARTRPPDDAHTVIWMWGSTLMLSAESTEFSTSSRMVV